MRKLQKKFMSLQAEVSVGGGGELSIIKMGKRIYAAGEKD
jgi:hypothetical protein